jgi:extracellular matrix regulatory protein A
MRDNLLLGNPQCATLVINFATCEGSRNCRVSPHTALIANFFMEIQLINIGFGNIVSANRVVAIVSPESAPIKRIITDARDRGQLVDATYGRRTRAVIITDSSHVILSAIQPETVANRFVISREHQAIEN